MQILFTRILAFMLSIFMLLPGSIYALFNKNATDNLFSGEEDEYVLTEDYKVTREDCERLANGLTLDLGGNVLDMNNISLADLSSEADIVISNGTLVNAGAFFASATNNIVLNQVSVDNGNKPLALAGNLTLLGTNLGEVYGGMVVDYKSKDFSAESRPGTKAKTIIVGDGACIGNLIVTGTAFVKAEGFIANLIITNLADYSTVEIAENANVGNIYVDASQVMILADEKSFVDNAFGAEDIINTVVSPYIYVEKITLSEMADKLEAIPAYTFKSHSQATCNKPGRVVLSYNNGENTDKFTLKAQHRFGEGVKVEKGYNLLDLYDYTCLDCGYTYRTIGEGSFVLEDCDNVIDLLSFYLKDFDYDYTFTPGTTYGDFVVNNGYLHLHCRDGKPTGVFFADYNDGEKNNYVKAYISGQEVYLYSEEGAAEPFTLHTTAYDYLMTELEKLTGQPISQYMDAAFDAAKRLILADGVADLAAYDIEYLKEGFDKMLDGLVPSDYFKTLVQKYSYFKTVTDLEGNTTHTFNAKNACRVLDEIAGMSVKNLIDNLYPLDEDDFDEDSNSTKIKQFLLNLPTMNTGDFMDLLMDMCDAAGVPENKIFDIINRICKLLLGEQSYYEICRGDIRTLLDEELDDVILNDALGVIYGGARLADILTADNVELLMKATPALIIAEMENPSLDKAMEVISNGELGDYMGFTYVTNQYDRLISAAFTVEEYGTVTYEQTWDGEETAEAGECIDKRLTVSYDHIETADDSSRVRTEAELVCDLGIDSELGAYIKEFGGYYKVNDLTKHTELTNIQSRVYGEYTAFNGKTRYIVTGVLFELPAGDISVKVKKINRNGKDRLMLSEVKISDTYYGDLKFIAEYYGYVDQYDFHLDAQAKNIPGFVLSVKADYDEKLTFDLDTEFTLCGIPFDIKAEYSKEYGGEIYHCTAGSAEAPFEIEYQRAPKELKDETAETFAYNEASILLDVLTVSYKDQLKGIYYQTETTLETAAEQGEETVKTPAALSFVHVTYDHDDTQWNLALDQEVAEKAFVLTQGSFEYNHFSTHFECKLEQALDAGKTDVLTTATLTGEYRGKKVDASFKQVLTDGIVHVSVASAKYEHGSTVYQAAFAQTVNTKTVLNKAMVQGVYGNKTGIANWIQTLQNETVLNAAAASYGHGESEIVASFNQLLSGETVVNSAEIHGTYHEQDVTENKKVEASFSQTVKDETTLNHASASYKHCSTELTAQFDQDVDDGVVLNAISTTADIPNKGGETNKKVAVSMWQTAKEEKALYHGAFNYTHFNNSFDVTYDQDIAQGQWLNASTVTLVYKPEGAENPKIVVLSFSQSREEDGHVTDHATFDFTHGINQLTVVFDQKVLEDALYHDASVDVDYRGKSGGISIAQTMDEDKALHNTVSAYYDHESTRLDITVDETAENGEILHDVAVDFVYGNKVYRAEFKQTMEENTVLYYVRGTYNHFSTHIDACYSEKYSEVFEEHPVLRSLALESSFEEGKIVADFSVAEDDGNPEKLNYNVTCDFESVYSSKKPTANIHVIGSNLYTRAKEDTSILLHNFGLDVLYAEKVDGDYSVRTFVLENKEVAENIATGEETDYRLNRTVVADYKSGYYKDDKAVKASQVNYYDDYSVKYCSYYTADGAFRESLDADIYSGPLQDSGVLSRKQYSLHGTSAQLPEETKTWHIDDAVYVYYYDDGFKAQFEVSEGKYSALSTKNNYEKYELCDVDIYFTEDGQLEADGTYRHVEDDDGFLLEDGQLIDLFATVIDFQLRDNYVYGVAREERYYYRSEALSDDETTVFLKDPTLSNCKDGYDRSTIIVEISSDVALWDKENRKVFTVDYKAMNTAYRDYQPLAELLDEEIIYKWDISGEELYQSLCIRSGREIYMEYLTDAENVPNHYTSLFVLKTASGEKLYKYLITEGKVETANNKTVFSANRYEAVAAKQQDGIVRETIDEQPCVVIPYATIDHVKNENGYDVTVTEYMSAFGGIFVIGTEDDYIALASLKEKAKMIADGKIFGNTLHVSLQKQGTKSVWTIESCLADALVVLPADEAARAEVIDNVAINTGITVEMDKDPDNLCFAVSYDLEDLWCRIQENFNSVTRDEKESAFKQYFDELDYIQSEWKRIMEEEVSGNPPFYVYVIAALGNDLINGVRWATRGVVDGLYYNLYAAPTELLAFRSVKTRDENGDFVRKTTLETNFKDESEWFGGRQYGEVTMEKTGTLYTATAKYLDKVYGAIAADITETSVQIIPLVIPYVQRNQNTGKYEITEYRDVSRYGFVLVLDNAEGVNSVTLRWKHYDNMIVAYVAYTETSLRVSAQYKGESRVKDFYIDFFGEEEGTYDMPSPEAFFDDKDIREFNQVFAGMLR